VCSSSCARFNGSCIEKPTLTKSGIAVGPLLVFWWRRSGDQSQTPFVQPRLQHSLYTEHAAPGCLQHNEVKPMNSHWVPLSSQQPTTPQSCPALPQQVPLTHR
jgi:hypothetical protein